MKLSLFILFFILHFKVTCSGCVSHLWYIGKQRQSIKPLLYYLVCREKQIRCKKCIYRVFVNEKGNYHIMKPYNNYLLYYLSSEVYLFGDISLCPTFQRFFVGESLCCVMHPFTCIFIFY